ncbi:hypothetical protein VKT23_020009 [Stygiomarasmius scandens]|uniref:Uncharacterized protein n=1 Tax=Marasmiellus scandens TaxID=2682957 RepID=A0ABR1IM02_9AGAR
MQARGLSSSVYSRFEQLLKHCRDDSSSPNPISSSDLPTDESGSLTTNPLKRPRRNYAGTMRETSPDPATNSTSHINAQRSSPACPDVDKGLVESYAEAVSDIALFNGDGELSTGSLDASALDQFTVLASELAIKHVLRLGDRNEGETTPIDPNAGFESVLTRGQDGYLHPFGLPHDSNMATKRTLAAVTHQEKTLRIIETRLSHLSSSTDPEVIQSTLLEAKEALKVHKEKVPEWRHSNVTDPSIERVVALMTSLESSLKYWRELHPDTMAI